MSYVNVSYKCAKCGEEVTHCLTTWLVEKPDAPLAGMPSFLVHNCADGSMGVCAPFQVTPCSA